MNILHITNWYPSKPSPLSAPWIRRHIMALSYWTTNYIYHLEIKKGPFHLFKGVNEDQSRYLIIQLPFEKWRINELLSFMLLVYVLFKTRSHKYDMINFHIAYPNCTYLHLIKRWINCPIVITEHWSGYHYNFNVSKPEKLDRIRRIFKNNIPVIAVSDALARDIKEFSKTDIKSYVTPNVVYTDVFRYRSDLYGYSDNAFFMVSQWKWPKDPFIVLKTWRILQEKYENIQLLIGGYGPQWNEIKKSIEQYEISGTVALLGKMNSREIADKMNHSVAFIHISEYETFSVVCAEALCCGTPVIASNVGGLPELIDKNNGILISNYEEDIIKAVDHCIFHKSKYNRKDIALAASKKFGEKPVGERYFEVIRKMVKK